MDFKIFNLSFFIIICYLLPQTLCRPKPQWSQNDINGYLANLDIKIPQEMIAEIVDNKMTGISIAKTFDKYQVIMKKKRKKNYIPYIIYKVTFA